MKGTAAERDLGPQHSLSGDCPCCMYHHLPCRAPCGLPPSLVLLQLLKAPCAQSSLPLAIWASQGAKLRVGGDWDMESVVPGHVYRSLGTLT